MKINEMSICNFRGIESLELKHLDSGMNVIVGVNGAGKTSILESVVMLMSWLVAGLKSQGSRGTLPSDKDVRIGSKSCSLSIRLDNGTEWSLCRGKSFSSRVLQMSCKTDVVQVKRLAQSIIDGVEAGRSTPVIVYYPVERIIAEAPVNIRRNASEPTIWDVYKGALSGNANFRTMFEWYRRQEDVENEFIRDDINYRDRSLTAIRDAVAAFFPDFSELRVRRRPYQAMVVSKDGMEIELTQLSQGEKCYLSLVCDIARRLAMANPGMTDPLKGDGIVLIDEVDLHLHPKWQSEITSRLMKAFPNCQFILSTHSAQVLSDLRREQVIPISYGALLDVSFEPYGKLSSQIMTNYFDVEHQRNSAVAADIDNAFAALKSGDRQSFGKLYVKLLGILGTSDGDMVNLIIDARRKGWL